MKEGIIWPNKPDAANPAIASSFGAECHWRRVADPERWAPFWLVLGMVAGSLLRDIGWVISIRRTWPFSERVTDWDKVQRFADERPSA
jgi:hypothetical protein